ncbi:L-rhamnose-H+ transport protein [Amphibacillus marinus]|uniref:L-rhamnose-H+ transport protein n=1 Tax=Amphibacillus marinus TaxID=872970 RepID=A0A1H8LD11_9BACI|nr:L-rhamnose/proton symporter RhaT [Amphibacillus marinus]SEO02696.1 L-rhamnose-H+ transport protein [Amphibacillus marinus]
MVIALSVLFLSCIFQGSFGICFKKYQPFSWETFWLLFSIIGILFIPHLWAFIEIPNYFSYLQATPIDQLLLAALMGLLWGISAVFYSKAIDMIGVSLVTGINLGFSLLLGTFIPMFIIQQFPAPRALGMLILSMVVLMIGVFILARAGFIKGRMTKTNQLVLQKKNLRIGFILALISGIGSAAINIGASAAHYPVNLAIAAGVNPVSASLLAWVVVFAGGFVANFVYALVKVLQNKTASDYIHPGASHAYLKVIVASFVWFAALAIYGKATHLLGELGPIVGWVGFNALALIIANLWGFRDHEWTGFPKAKRLALLGNAIIIISIAFVALANTL